MASGEQRIAYKTKKRAEKRAKTRKREAAVRADRQAARQEKAQRQAAREEEKAQQAADLLPASSVTQEIQEATAEQEAVDAQYRNEVTGDVDLSKAFNLESLHGLDAELEQLARDEAAALEEDEPDGGDAEE